ncbi:hypothetical protein GE061_007901 [Apolygus lucorum]|uniref:Uncharacterized protein n=1 Tax=Apolygus lucorum TaxID=248454 RepID=A0A6A4J2V4_APOLU|nr:hypothetical protein GE061_007901 [Apolygus lucorum]
MLERYVLWMVENPKHYRPPYLMKCGYFQRIVDKHGGSEEAIRQKTAAMKLLAAKAGKSMAGLNIGMQSDLKKLKEMSEAGKKPKNQE